jgi:hypothetical protein
VPKAKGIGQPGPIRLLPALQPGGAGVAHGPDALSLECQMMPEGQQTLRSQCGKRSPSAIRQLSP